MEDGRCKLGLQGRLELVLLIEAGSTLRAAAAALSVAPATAHRWWHRWRLASPEDRASRACLGARPPVPKSCPWALSPEAEQMILAAREKTNYGPMQLQFLTGRHRSTIWKVLHRHGVSRQRRTHRPQTTRRYEWAEAGALLHIDAFELPKFDRPGHWAHGDRAEQHKTRNAGKVKIVGVIDDRTRLVYTEIHAGETGAAVSATLRRAAAWFVEQGCGPVQAVMSDNAKCYTTSRQSRPPWPSSTRATSASRPGLRAGTGRSSASSAPSTANGLTAASGNPPASATTPCHRSSATTTDAARTQPATAAHPSPAFTNSASTTPRRLSASRSSSTPRVKSRDVV